MSALSPPEPLTDHHRVDDFNSGESSLDEWLKGRTRANQASGASRTFVVCDGGRVVGYYALATGAVTVKSVPGVPLGTTYPAIVERVRRVAGHAELVNRCTLVVDGTGVGRPVVDLLRGARLRCNVPAVAITGGEAETSRRGYYGVPKRDLITGLQVLLQRGTLRIPAELEHGPLLVKEMAEMRVKMTSSGREQYGTWREGQHDDLVFAVALACWGMGKVYGRAAGEVGWWQRLDQGEGEKRFKEGVGRMQKRVV